MPHLTPVVIVSYPKSGRTWLAAMLGKALCAHVGLPERKIFDLFKGANQPRKARGRIPPMVFSHEGASFDELQPPESLRADIRPERGRFILLVRDPRDALVSHYHQLIGRKRFADERKKGEPPGDGASRLTRSEFSTRAGLDADQSGQLTLSAFIRSRMFGVGKIIRFYEVWSAALASAPQRCHLLRYESLHEAPAAQLLDALAFIGVEGVMREQAERAVEFARFDNMRALEAQGALRSGKLKPVGDGPSAFKTRKGKVGGYREELAPDDIAFLTRTIDDSGCPFYAGARV